MNYARKWHEVDSKRVEGRVENSTNQARKWYKPGSEMERTRLENGTNQARKWNEPGSKMERTRLENGTNHARTRHEPGSKMAQKQGSKIARTKHEKKHEPGSKQARKILQFVSFRLEAGHAKWLELRPSLTACFRRTELNSICRGVCMARSKHGCDLDTAPN